MMSDENPPASDLASLEPNNDAPRKEKHEFLAALLRDSRSSLIDFMFKQAAVITLVLGWIFSSKTTQEFVQTHPRIGEIAISAICIYFVLLTFWIWNYRQRSNSAYQHLLNLRYMPKEFYSTLRVSDAVAVSFMGAHFILCVVLVMALLEIK